MSRAFASPEQTRAATGLLGCLLVAAYAISFTTALQRVYLRAWRRPAGGGVRNKGRGAMWLAGLLVLLVAARLAAPDRCRPARRPSPCGRVGVVGSVLCLVVDRPTDAAR